jgi:hypothetical protein
VIEKLFAAAVLAVCAVLFVRLLIGARHRRRLDAALRGAAQAGRRAVGTAWHWRAARRTSKEAADEVIRRARDGGTWDGNVYRPKSFRKPPRDKMH